MVEQPGEDDPASERNADVDTASDLEGDGDDEQSGQQSDAVEQSRDGKPRDDESRNGTSRDGNRCDFCRLELPASSITSDHQGITYTFCSNACRNALEESDRVFTTYHGFRQFQPGVTAMDAGLPEGMPRNAFVLVSSQSGTRDEAVHAELVWRALQRDEPVLIVSFLETPTSIVQEFVGLDWNVLPHLESGDLHVLDCFSYRVDDIGDIVDRMNAFNRHLQSVVSDATTTVRDPADLSLVRSRLDDCLEELGMHDRGIVIVDSLTELGTLVQPVKAYDFVKSVRADVAKGRFVPVFAGATRTGDADRFPHDLEYMVDGIVDLRFTEELVPNTLLKQLRIRKMVGVLTIPEWHTYEYTAGDGQIVFDPDAEIKKAKAEREAAENADTDENSENARNSRVEEDPRADDESRGDEESMADENSRIDE